MVAKPKSIGYDVLCCRFAGPMIAKLITHAGNDGQCGMFDAGRIEVDEVSCWPSRPGKMRDASTEIEKCDIDWTCQ